MSETATLTDSLRIHPLINQAGTALPFHEIGSLIRNSRKEAGITQDQLAKKIGTSKSYISKIESGHSDIQLSTLMRIFETGFGRKLIFNLI